MNVVSDIMSKHVRVLQPDHSLQEAAQTMNELNVGVIPVCDGHQLVGIVTDRDITVRGVAHGKDVNTTSIREVMTSNVYSCFEDETINEVCEKMADAQIRRLPVINQKQELVGIISLGDLAARYSYQDAAETLREISLPVEN